MTVKRIFSVGLSTAWVMMAFAAVARGETLIEESFDYAPTSWVWEGDYEGPVTESGLDGGIGFVDGSQWGVCLQSGTTGNVSIIEGMTFNGLQTSGSALFTQNVSNSALISRAIDVAVAPGATVWTSYLWRHEDTSMGGLSCAYSQLTDSQFGTTNRRLRILPNQYMTSTTCSISDGSARYDLTIPELQDGDTYLLIAKNTNIGQAGTGNLWAMAASGYAICAADDVITEQELNDNCVGSTSGALASNTMTSGAFLQLANLWGAGAFDEFRMGTSLADVTPARPIPEPGTVMILFTGLVGLVCCIRFKKK